VPIRLRLALAFALVVVVVFSVAALLFVRSFRRGLEDSLDQTLRVQASTLARAVRDAGGPLDLGDRTAGRLHDDDDVAQLLDADGRVLEATEDVGRSPLVRGDDLRADGAAFRRVAVVEADDRDDDDDDEVEAEPYRVIGRPIEGAGDVRYVVVGTALEPTDDAVERVEEGLLVGGAVAVVVAGIGAWFLAGAALRPVERLRREAADLSVHDPGARLEVPRTHDELQALGSTMNDLLARLQGALTRQRSFVADAGHELRTPIAVLRTELELAQRGGRTRLELVDAIDHAAIEIDRLAELTDALLLLARADEGDAAIVVRPDDVRLDQVVERAFDATAGAAAVRQVTIERTVERLPVTGDANLLTRAVANLLENAVRHAPAGTSVEVLAARRGDAAQVAVTDRGPGFPPEFLPHAFERFRRADDARSRTDGGHGLGLAIVLAIMEAHGGTATAANRADGGATVTLSMPVREVAPQLPLGSDS
jgi:heavy metal sensor kinase